MLWSGFCSAIVFFAEGGGLLLVVLNNFVCTVGVDRSCKFVIYLSPLHIKIPNDNGIVWVPVSDDMF